MTLAARASPDLTAGVQLSAVISNPTAEDSGFASLVKLPNPSQNLA